MKINIGDYVRIDGYISKIGNIRKSSSGKTYVQWKQPNGLLASGNINIIEKSSPNIIDLIEVGDYVNGKLVAIVNGTDKCTSSFYQPNVQCRQEENHDYEQIFDDEIKSIVTREMFESMEYKIGE